MINKKQLLFDLRNVVKYISYEDLQEILQNAVSYTTDHYITIKFCDNSYITICIANYQFLIYGSQLWFDDNSIRHRIGKPAETIPGRVKRWYLRGDVVKEEFLRKI